ncbi:hypothetical protein D5346_07965, partial [Campylobacter jejuni]|nr:hypothetical protein [Campylobacter jejuni]EAJ9893787.1 hypothetical protein [Campylobacter coli]EAL1488511.1 hypothetical protein [Campylobacter jejuni]MLY92886.1 hypothetical protein [Campylobacter jejuni]
KFFRTHYRCFWKYCF